MHGDLHIKNIIKCGNRQLYVRNFSRTCKLNVEGISEKTKQYLKCLDALNLFKSDFFKDCMGKAHSIINQRMLDYVGNILKSDEGLFADQILKVLQLHTKTDSRNRDLMELYKCDVISPDDENRSGKPVTFVDFCFYYRFIE